ncbi:MAG TPA: hypothetical protein VMU69_18650 [Bradyrhizobium sp.]|nr:hypothetical protein [Bradyrhizobium sp.]
MLGRWVGTWDDVGRLREEEDRLASYGIVGLPDLLDLLPVMVASVGNVQMPRRILEDMRAPRALAGYPWLEIECSRCKARRDVDLAALRHPPTTFVHDLAGRLRCSKCAEAGKRPAATLLQLAPRSAETLRKLETCDPPPRPPPIRFSRRRSATPFAPPRAGFHQA